ncbi:MAG TPA: hypothetical protein VLT58_16535, partial [Polyangia bacterium]|nr:hypothetical protein [Polyangia bacterium]
MSRPPNGWDALLAAREREALSSRLIGYARQRRWFRGKSRSVTGAQISDVLPLDADTTDAAANVLVVVEVQYAEGEPDLYVIPMTWAPAEELRKLREKHPHTLIGTDDGLVDGLATGEAAVSLLDMARGNLTRRGHHGVLTGEASDLLGELVPDGAAALRLRVAGVEQTNSTV